MLTITLSNGAYWHDNFGQPMSRGCVSMRNADAEWLCEWAGSKDAPIDADVTGTENAAQLRFFFGLPELGRTLSRLRRGHSR